MNKIGTEPLYTGYFHHAGLATHGKKRILLTYDFGETERYTIALRTAAKHFFGEGGKRRSSNAASELARVVCYIAANEDVTLTTTIEQINLEMSPIEAKREFFSDGLFSVPSSLSVAVTLPECVDLPNILDIVSDLASVYKTDGVVVGAHALWAFMQSRHLYQTSNGSLDTHLLHVHALQNAIAVVRPALFEAMVSSVSEMGESSINEARPWLPGSNDNFTSYFLQSCPRSLALSSEARSNAGMSSEFAAECDVLWVNNTEDLVTATFSIPNKTVEITSEVISEAVKNAEMGDFLEHLTSVGLECMTVTVARTENRAVAVCNWQPFTCGEMYPEVFARAASVIYKAMTNCIARLFDCSVKSVCIIACDSNLASPDDCDMAATFLYEHGLEMFNSADSSASNKCCKVTVNQRKKTIPLSTEWGEKHLKPVVATRDVLIVPLDHGPFDISASVVHAGTETPRGDFFFSHVPFTFVVSPLADDASNSPSKSQRSTIVAKSFCVHWRVYARVCRLFFVVWIFFSFLEILKDNL